MVGIVSNAAAMFAQRSLETSNSASEASIARLSSGEAIIKASDDASGLAVGTRLSTNVSTLRTVGDSIDQATSLLEIADGGLAEISDILDRQKSLAVQANSGSLSDTERAFLNEEFQQLAEEVDRIVEATTFNGIQLIDGSIFNASEVSFDESVTGTAYTATLQFGAIADDADQLTLTDANGDSYVIDFQANGGGDASEVDVGASGANGSASNLYDFLVGGATNTALTQGQRNILSSFEFAYNGTDTVTVTSKIPSADSDIGIAVTTDADSDITLNETSGTSGNVAIGDTTYRSTDVTGDSILTAASVSTTFAGDTGSISFNGTTDAGTTAFTIAGTGAAGAFSITITLGTDTATSNASGSVAASELTTFINNNATLIAAGVTAEVTDAVRGTVTLTDANNSGGASNITIAESVAGTVDDTLDHLIKTADIGETQPEYYATVDLEDMSLNGTDETGSFAIGDVTFQANAIAYETSGTYDLSNLSLAATETGSFKIGDVTIDINGAAGSTASDVVAGTITIDNTGGAVTETTAVDGNTVIDLFAAIINSNSAFYSASVVGSNLVLTMTDPTTDPGVADRLNDLQDADFAVGGSTWDGADGAVSLTATTVTQIDTSDGNIYFSQAAGATVTDASTVIDADTGASLSLIQGIVNTINNTSAEYTAVITDGTVVQLALRDPSATPLTPVTDIDETNLLGTNSTLDETAASADTLAVGLVGAGAEGAGTSTTTTAGGVSVNNIVNNTDFVGSITGFSATYISTDQVQVDLEVGDNTYTAIVYDTNVTADTTVRFVSNETGTESGGSFDLTFAANQGLSVTSQANADTFAERLDSAFSTLTFLQNKTAASSSYSATGTIYTGSTQTGSLAGSSVDFKLSDFSKAEVADISVSAPATGATDYSMSVTLSNGEVFSTAAGVTNDIQSGSAVTLTSTTDPSESIVFTFGTGTLTGGDTGDSANSVVLLENASQAVSFENALRGAFGLEDGNGGLSFQVGIETNDTISVALQSAETTTLYKDDAGVYSALDISTAEGAQSASAVLDNAINTVAALRSQVGALQSRFEAAASAVATTESNLDAARGTFLDVDVASESTDFATAQVRLQASIAVLAQANQLPQNLLKLLG